MAKLMSQNPHVGWILQQTKVSSSSINGAACLLCNALSSPAKKNAKRRGILLLRQNDISQAAIESHTLKESIYSFLRENRSSTMLKTVNKNFVCFVSARCTHGLSRSASFLLPLLSSPHPSSFPLSHCLPCPFHLCISVL